MSLIKDKFEKQLAYMNNFETTKMLRAAVDAMPEDKQREFIIEHLPAMPKSLKDEMDAIAEKEGFTVCSNCNFDMGENFENCGASEDGVCPECGYDREKAIHERHCSEDACKYGEDNCSVANKAAEEAMEPVEWDVPVTRVGVGFRTITVQARSEKEAIELALKEAGEHTYSEKESDYTAPDGATKL